MTARQAEEIERVAQQLAAELRTTRGARFSTSDEAFARAVRERLTMILTGDTGQRFPTPT